eukprot:TRINITY_DN3501_c0_g1_i1.p1 TRINITY_DN3501_c0_g1~~TRINITY_DN3501_c0_g1_i1.p1  ORF type:complete len:110 (-),score=20.06 TRINITY_DN3501_c0_g1_i1:213-542(-)
MDYFATLGVEIGASITEIRSAYLKKAIEVHPDKPGGDKAKFQKLVEAFEFLSDTAQRNNANDMCMKGGCSTMKAAHFSTNAFQPRDRAHGSSAAFRFQGLRQRQSLLQH